MSEVFSSQTRQTRTALAASATSLLLYSTGGVVDGEIITLAGANFGIPKNWFYWLLWFTTFYFLMSFSIASSQERQKYRYVESLDFLKERINTLSSLSETKLVSAKRSIEQAAHYLSGMSAPPEDRTKYQFPFIDTHDNSTKNVNAPLAADYLSDANKDIGEACSFIQHRSKKIIEAIENIDNDFAQAERVKINWLEFKLPIIYGILTVGLAPIFAH